MRAPGARMDRNGQRCRIGQGGIRAAWMGAAFLLSTTGLLALQSVQAAPGRYLSTDAFLADVFEGASGESASLMVDAALRSEIENVLGHRFPRLRLRYWQDDGRTAWVIDEVAKTEPVTIGVGIEDGLVKSVRVLEFRESRGWEIRYPFFTDQFRGAALEADTGLDRSIDSITGATLSVDAVQRVVRLALLLDRQVRALRDEETESTS